MCYILTPDSITWTRLVWVGTAGKVIRDGLEGGGGGGAVGKNCSVVSSSSLKVVEGLLKIEGGRRDCFQNNRK